MKIILLLQEQSQNYDIKYNLNLILVKKIVSGLICRIVKKIFKYADKVQSIVDKKEKIEKALEKQESKIEKQESKDSPPPSPSSSSSFFDSKQVDQQQIKPQKTNFEINFNRDSHEESVIIQKESKQYEIAAMIFILAYFITNFFLGQYTSSFTLSVISFVIQLIACLVSFLNFSKSRSLVAYISTCFFFVGGIFSVNPQMTSDILFLNIIGASVAMQLGDNGQNKADRMKNESYGIVTLIFLSLYWIGQIEIDNDIQLCSYVLGSAGCFLSIIGGIFKNNQTCYIVGFFILFIAAVANSVGFLIQNNQTELCNLLMAQWTFYIALASVLSMKK